MSQYPTPPMAPPPGYGAPPPPGPYGGYMPPGQPKKSNGAAIGSLVCGVLFCIPAITSLVAIILGFIGLRKARDPQVGGKGLAIAGLILGFLGVGMWVLFGGAIFALVKGTGPQRDVARQVVTDLAASNVDAAAANTDPASINREELEALSQQMQGWGTLTDTWVIGVNAPGQTETALAVVMQYGQVQRQFEAVVSKGSDGKYKVTALRYGGP